MLEVVVTRALKASSVSQVVIATTLASADDEVETICELLGVACVRGSEDDVLQRYVDAAEIHGADLVVRLTADDPFKDPIEIDELVGLALTTGDPFVANNFSLETPEGMDIEVFTKDFLLQAAAQSSKSFEREHVTPWMRARVSNSWKSLSARYANWPEVRLTIDVENDFKFAREVFTELKHGACHATSELLALLRARPDLTALNAGAQERYAGLRKSMQEDSCETTS